MRPSSAGLESLANLVITALRIPHTPAQAHTDTHTHIYTRSSAPAPRAATMDDSNEEYEAALRSLLRKLTLSSGESTPPPGSPGPPSGRVSHCAAPSPGAGLPGSRGQVMRVSQISGPGLEKPAESPWFGSRGPTHVPGKGVQVLWTVPASSPDFSTFSTGKAAWKRTPVFKFCPVACCP